MKTLKEFLPLVFIATIVCLMMVTGCAHTPRPGEPGYTTCTRYTEYGQQTTVGHCGQ